jgi:hypothetical protein
MTTQLNGRQHRKLDRVHNEDPAAKVIGWDRVIHGPVVRTRAGEIFVVAPTGYPRQTVAA